MAGCAVMVLAWALQVGPARARGAVPSQTPDIRDIYLRDCATCHGADGHGTDLAPDLRGAGAALVDYYLSTGRMPLPTPDATVARHHPAYPPRTIDALVGYVTTLTGGGGPPIPSVDVAAGDLAAGGTLFRLQCAACHAWSGDGGALLHREAPSTHRATPLQIAEAVRSGPGNMPAFGVAALTHAQMQDVVRYVRYLDHPDDRGGNGLGHLGPLAEGAVAVFVGLGLLLVAVRWIGTRT
jgi:ubiquinol-cytochrome c reductase cytochrome c subunit